MHEWFYVIIILLFFIISYIYLASYPGSNYAGEEESLVPAVCGQEGLDMRTAHVTINILSVYTLHNSRAYVRN